MYHVKIMKIICQKILLIICFLIFASGFSQNKIPVIKSNSLEVKIIEDNLSTSNWNLNSKLKPDIYTSGKIIKSKNVKLVTDIDSIQVDLKPGQKFDFIVLYKNKDSCFTRFESYQTNNLGDFNQENDTIHFKLNDKNNIILKTIINKKDTLDLTFDTGASSFSLLRNIIKKQYNSDGKKDKILMSDINDAEFKIGNLTWKHQQIYPVGEVPFDTFGLVGWEPFDGKIIEINYDKNILVVHNKKLKIDPEYQPFKITYIREHFFINAELQIKNKKFKSLFLFDSGYQATALLDKDVVREQNYPAEILPIIKKSTLKNSNNEDINVITILNDKINFGKYTLKNVPVQISSSANSLGFNAHWFGNEVLKRFNTIFDFKNNIAYLKPNHFFNEEYGEKLKKR
jgi:hypothetical protein